MPNWVSNLVKVEGSRKDLDDFRDFVAGNNRDFTFENIIATPPELIDENIAESSGYVAAYLFTYLTDKGTKEINPKDMELLFTKLYFFDWSTKEAKNILKNDKNANSDEYYDKGRTYYRRLKKYGATDWYSFHLMNWNTKWDAENSKVTDGGNIFYYEFDTAWGAPYNIFVKLAEKFPNLKIKDYYADEDIGGGNWGVIVCDNGESYTLDNEAISDDDEATETRAHHLIASGFEIESFEDVMHYDDELTESESEYLTPEENKAIAKMIEGTDIRVCFDDAIDYCLIHNNVQRIDFLRDNYEDHDDNLLRRVKEAISLIMNPTDELK